MKAVSSAPSFVLEWSPGGVTLFNPSTRKTARFHNIREASSSVSGDLVVALGRRTSFIRTARLPDAAKDDVAKILSLQLGQLFPMQPSEASTDFVLTENRSLEGRLAVVAAVRTDLLRQVTAELQSAGLIPKAIVPVALGSALVAQAVSRPECAVVRESEDGLCIDVVHEGELRASRVAPMVRDAAWIEGEVCRSFAALKLPCAESVASAGFQFAGADITTEHSDLGCLSTAELGLNLELPEHVAKRARAKLEKMKRLALLLWVAALGYAAVIFDQRSTDAAIIAKGDRRWVSQISSLKKLRDQASKASGQLGTVATALDMAFDAKQPLPDVIKVLATEMPPNVWVTGLTVERGKPVLIRGTATNGPAVQKYLAALSAQDRFRDAKLIFANDGTIESTNVVNFSMSAHVVGNLPLVDPTAKKVKR